MMEESSERSLCSRRLSSLCPGVPPSPPFPPQKIHRREILPHEEVRTGKYSRCFQCVGAMGSVLQRVRDRWQLPSCYLRLIARHSRWIQMPGIRKTIWGFKIRERDSMTRYLAASFFPSIICLRHVRSEVFSTDIGLPWKDPVGLCLLFYHFGNKVFIKSRLNKVQNLRIMYSTSEYDLDHCMLFHGCLLELILRPTMQCHL